VKAPKHGAITGRALPARLGDRSLVAVRVLWLAFFTPLVGLVAFGFIRAYRAPEFVAIGPLVELFVTLGLSDRLMMTIGLLIPFVMTLAVAVVVFVRRAHDPMALVFTGTLLLLYIVTSRTLLTYEAVPVLRHSYAFLLALAFVGLAFVLAVFPDGRYVPGWTRWLAPAMVVVALVFPDAARLFEGLFAGEVVSQGRLRAMVLCVLLVLASGISAQIHRYRHVSDRTQRLQTKWVVTPLAAVLTVSVAAFGVPAAIPAAGDVWLGWSVFAMIPVGTLTPVAVANAVLRHRLYEIDRIISRTVSYGIVVVMLASVYVAGVVGVGAALSGLSGDDGGDLRVAASVLVVAALFRPVRSRVQAAVGRRFDRTGYEARIVIEDFGHRLRDQVDVSAVGAELAETAVAALAPSWASVWLAPNERRPSDL
jgi:hypothetical protein